MVCASCNSFRLVCLYKYFIKKASQETEIIEVTLIYYIPTKVVKLLFKNYFETISQKHIEME